MASIFFGIVTSAVVVGILSIIIRLERFLSGFERGSRRQQFPLRKVVLTVAFLGSMFLFMTGNIPERRFALLVFAMLVLAWAALTWLGEFVYLMNLHDDDFPGRFDKLIWAVALLFFAPVGIWAFRSYRSARWPELKKSSRPTYGDVELAEPV